MARSSIYLAEVFRRENVTIAWKRREYGVSCLRVGFWDSNSVIPIPKIAITIDNASMAG